MQAHAKVMVRLSDVFATMMSSPCQSQGEDIVKVAIQTFNFTARDLAAQND
jgi:hypothetical protein